MSGPTVAIVGCGVAGDEAAFAARRADPSARIVVFTADPLPLVSPCVLADYVAGELPRERTHLRPVAAYREAGIELRLEEPVRAWDPERRELLTAGGRHPYDRLVWATGSRATFPDLPGVGLPGVLSLRTLSDADALRAPPPGRAVVVGTGLVGVEAAWALRERGWDVTLVGRRGRVLPRLFDEPIAARLAEALEGIGIRLVLGESPVEVLGTARAEGLRTTRAAYPADLVVFGAGQAPRVELAAAGGVALGPSGGIATDEAMATNLPGVYACGDCAETVNRLTGRRGVFMLWHNARRQGRVAGIGAAGARARYPGSLGVSTVHAGQVAAASIGTPAAEHRDGSADLVHRRTPDGEIALVIRSGRVVGAQALGNTARIGELTAAVIRRVAPERLPARPTPWTLRLRRVGVPTAPWRTIP